MDNRLSKLPPLGKFFDPFHGYLALTNSDKLPEEDLFLNEEDPHLEHTILPPKDRSETNEELPQLKQILFTLI